MEFASRKIQLRVLLTISALIITYAFSSLYQEKFDFWNSRTIDYLFSLRSRIKPANFLPENRIVHVDANLNAFRSQHAQVIRNLSAMDIEMLAFDTVFSEQVGEEEDLPLIRATKSAGNVILGVRFKSKESSYTTPDNDEMNSEQIHALDSVKWHITVNGKLDRFITLRNPMMTFPELALAARGIGHLNIIPAPDGILRELPLLVRYGDALYPSIALQVVCQSLDISPERIILRPGRSIVLKGVSSPQSSIATDLIIPIDANSNMIINYRGSWEQIRHFSYSEILQLNRQNESFEKIKKDFAGKIVVMSEAVATPFKGRPISADNNFSSGTIHSIVIQNILQGSFLRKLSWPEMAFIELLLLAAFLLISIRFSAPTLSLATVFLSAFYIIIGASGFINFNLILRFVQPLIALYSALLLVLSASAIEKAILLAETERARKLAERELEIGRKIQAGFFPSTLPAPNGWELVTYFQAARHVSGDFYDAFSIGKKEDIGFVVADVCDKGVGAALFMALFRSLIRVLSGSAGDEGQSGNNYSHQNPAQTLQYTIQSVNNYISTTHEADGMFSTIFFGILNPKSGAISYINGGHEPPIIIRNQRIETYLNPTGPAVGLYPNAKFNVGKIQIEPEDIVLSYTDGVVDAQNRFGEYFSKDRLVKLVTESSLSAKNLVDKISSRINNYNIGQDQFDDITILALQRK